MCFEMFQTSYVLTIKFILLFASVTFSYNCKVNVPRFKRVLYSPLRLVHYQNFPVISRSLNAHNALLSTDEDVKQVGAPELAIISSFLTSEGDYLGSFNWSVEVVSSTITNSCYKCTPIGTGGKSVFLKYSHQLPQRNTSYNRLRYEFEGMRVFSKYSPKDVPRVILYDENKKILISEWLERFVPLSNYFGFYPIPKSTAAVSSHLEVDSDTCRAMGTIMGRSHARTHRCILTPMQYNHLRDSFKNEESVSKWGDNVFVRALELLRSPREDQGMVGRILADYNSYDRPVGSPAEGSLFLAIETLRKSFLENKESLVHADLSSNNIMMSSSDDEEDGDSRSGDRRSRPFKVINFATCRMGPPGLDLGTFLANFLWYYAGHSEASRRRGAVSGVMAAIDSYKSAFRVQLGGTSGTGGAARALQKERQRQHDLIKLREELGYTIENIEAVTEGASKPLNVEDILNQILLDAIGFMGMSCLSMAIEDGQKDREGGRSSGGTGRQSLEHMPEMRWGSTDSRAAFVQQRQIEMSLMAILTYLDCTLSARCSDVEDAESSQQGQKAPSSVVTAQTFAAIFQADDKTMASHHMTEFWY